MLTWCWTAGGTVQALLGNTVIGSGQVIPGASPGLASTFSFPITVPAGTPVGPQVKAPQALKECLIRPCPHAKGSSAARVVYCHEGIFLPYQTAGPSYLVATSCCTQLESSGGLVNDARELDIANMHTFPQQVITLVYSGTPNFAGATSGQNGNPVGPTLTVVRLLVAC